MELELELGLGAGGGIKKNAAYPRRNDRENNVLCGSGGGAVIVFSRRRSRQKRCKRYEARAPGVHGRTAPSGVRNRERDAAPG